MEDRADYVADRFEARGKDRDRGKGRARGGRGGRGGASGGMSRQVEVSKALSKLLRHQALGAGIKLDKEGYAPLDEVLQWGPLRAIAPSFAELRQVVSSSDKQRFATKPNPRTNPALDEESADPAHWLIRANQGHSIKLESEGLLRPILLHPEAAKAAAPPTQTPAAPSSSSSTAAAGADAATGVATTATTEAVVPRSGALPVPVPPVVVHGTYFAFWPTIVASGGLRPMGRNHVHFATGVPEAGTTEVVSGMRRDAELLVYVDVAQSLRDGAMTWWMSENGVVLTEGVKSTGEGERGEEEGLVPLRYFSEVVGRRKDGAVGVLWKDGERVADLPVGLKIVVPQGKGRGAWGRTGEGKGKRKVGYRY